MWLTVLLHSLIYFTALVAAIFLILALQIFMRAVGLNQVLWNIFPHSFILEASGRPKVKFRKRLIFSLAGCYLFILIGLSLLALR
jgi:hypothetical protein